MRLPETHAALDQVLTERIRQTALLAAGKFQYGPEDPELTDAELLTVLTEEVGEVAREICECIGHPERLTRAQRIRLRDELIQVAAVAVGRCELLNREIAGGGWGPEGAERWDEGHPVSQTTPDWALPPCTELQ